MAFAIDHESPQCLYTIGLGAKDIGTCSIDASDLVIAIGFDMVEYHPNLWNPDGDKSIIHIDFIPAEIDRSFHPEMVSAWRMVSAHLVTGSNIFTTSMICWY